MTKAEETLSNYDFDIHYYGDGKTDILTAMSNHAKEFAEWCGSNEWIFVIHNTWIKPSKGESLTTSELYTLFNNQ